MLGGLYSGTAAKADDSLYALPPAGETIVALSASEQKEVEQDTLVANLRIEVEDEDARVVQDKINKAMQKAVDVVKRERGLDVATGQYYVFSQVIDPRVKILSSANTERKVIWKGNQSLQIQSKDSKTVLDVVANMQKLGFVMNGLNYTLSDAKAEVYQDELLAAALKKIQDKAALVAKSLNKKSYDIAEVNVNGANMPRPVPMARGMAKMEMSDAMSSVSMAAPVATPGKTTLRLSVSARVVLK